MTLDDSFKKPGAVPFQWELRPGVPKQTSLDDYQFEFKFRKQHHRHHQTLLHKHSSLSSIHNSNPFPETRPKLKPPPAGFYFQSPSEPRTRSFRLPSGSRRFGLPVLAQPDIVSSGGCFPSPSSMRKTVKSWTSNRPGSTPEPEYYSDLEVVSARWSVSSRKSVSPPSSSFASYQSSPRPVSDSDWAGFGLF